MAKKNSKLFQNLDEGYEQAAGSFNFQRPEIKAGYDEKRGRRPLCPKNDQAGPFNKLGVKEAPGSAKKKAAFGLKDENTQPDALQLFPSFVRKKIQSGRAPLGLLKVVSRDCAPGSFGKGPPTNKKLAKDDGFRSNRGNEPMGRDEEPVFVGKNSAIQRWKKLANIGQMADEAEKVPSKPTDEQLESGMPHGLPHMSEARRLYELILNMYTSGHVFAPQGNEKNPKLTILLPRLGGHIVERFRESLERRNFSIIRRVFNLLEKIVANGLGVFENQLDCIITMAASCVVSHALNEQPDKDEETVKRIEAAGIVTELISELSADEKHMNELVAGVYKETLREPDIGLMELFGAIVGLTKMGPDIVELHLLPFMPSISSRLLKARVPYAFPCKAEKMLIREIRTRLDEQHLLY